MRKLLGCRWFSVVVGIGLASPSSVRAVGPSTDITAEHLVEAGLHLPSYMPTILKVMNYQSQLTQHQELKVDWDSLPGRTGTLRKQDVEGIALSPNFVLVSRKQKLPGGAGKSNTGVGEDRLVIVAVTAHNEVRGLTLQGDPRASHAEDFSGGSGKRYDFVEPRVTINIRLPDDPQIQTLIFFKPAANTNSDGGWHLEKIGTLTLPAK